MLPTGSAMFPRPDFFAGARLNFAENILFPANADVRQSATAVITATEQEGQITETTWAELREQVRLCANALRAAGVRQGNIVAGFSSNHVQTLVALLSAASLGAIWTGISPDNGTSAVLDRLAQIGPKVLFADSGTLYNGKQWPSTTKTLQIVDELKHHGLELVVVVRNIEGLDPGLEELRSKNVLAEEYEDFLKR